MIPGTRLGHYEIRARIGAGGMGEVYLAHDSKLDRQVALKILPPELAANADRMRRFVQEAKAAAALNHPNIAHVYEIGEEKGTHFIAMEFIDGVTLSQRIHREPIELRKLLRFLQHAAEGLAKAHAAGIVHRDLKPDNIMITSEGHAKVLDFGLAKLFEHRFTGANSRNSQNTTVRMAPRSISGTIMGTVGYMSPEQAEGRVNNIDQRSDIFSFGCILFEAVTGRLPFAGNSAVNSLHKTIHEAAPPIKEFNPAAPADLQRIISRCLAKDPEDRYQTIKDLAIELRDLRHELERKPTPDPATTANHSATSGTAQLVTQSVSAGAQTGHSSTDRAGVESSRRRIIAVVAVIVVVVAVLLSGFYILRRRNLVVPFAESKVSRITSSGKATDAAISPDGRYIVHVVDNAGQQSVQLRQVATNTNQEIISPAKVVYSGLTFSPDGNYLYYTMSDNSSPSPALYRKPVLGGEETKLTENVKGRAALSPDGKRLAFLRVDSSQDETELVVANADGADQQKLASRKAPDYYRSLAWSPDGNVIALSTGTFKGNYHGTVVTIAASGGVEHSLTTQTWYRTGPVGWLGDGSGLILSATVQSYGVHQLWYISYPEGKARQITHDLNNYAAVSLTSDSKSLVTVQREQTSSIWIAPVSRGISSGNLSINVSDSRQIPTGSRTFDGRYGLSWMPDGRLTYTSAVSGDFDIWIMQQDGSAQRQLTSDPKTSIYTTDNYASASRDGRYILFTTDRETGNPHVWRMNSDGSDLKRLTNGPGEGVPKVTPDGRTVIYFDFTTQLLWKIPIEGGQPQQITDKHSDRPFISPDGRFIACGYQAGPNAPFEIAVISIEGKEPLKLFEVPLTVNVDDLAWTPDGSAIVYSDTRNGVSNFWSQKVDGGPAEQLTDFKSDRIYSFEFSPDGKSLALARGNSTADVVLFNWIS